MTEDVTQKFKGKTKKMTNKTLAINNSNWKLIHFHKITNNLKNVDDVLTPILNHIDKELLNNTFTFNLLKVRKCASCHKEFEDEDLDMVGGVWICRNCEELLK